MYESSVMVHLEATKLPVKFHCPHDAGRSSYSLGWFGSSMVYLRGTPDEIEALASEIIRVVRERRAAEILCVVAS